MLPISVLRKFVLLAIANPLFAESQLSILVLDGFGVEISVYKGTLTGKSATLEFSGTTNLMVEPGDYELKIESTGFQTQRIPIRLKDQPLPVVVCLRVGSLAPARMPDAHIAVTYRAEKSGCDKVLLQPVYMNWAPPVVAVLQNGSANVKISEFGRYVVSITGPQEVCTARLVSINVKTTALAF